MCGLARVLKSNINHIQWLNPTPEAIINPIPFLPLDEVIPVEPTGKVAEADEEEECEEEEEEGEETVNNDTDEVSTKNPKMADLLVSGQKNALLLLRVHLC
jgi:hypothetical protein